MSSRLYPLLKQLDAYHRHLAAHPRLTAPVRLASYGVYRGLELALGERHPHERVIAAAGRLEETAPRRAAATRRSPAPRVLLYLVRGWFVHATFQAVLAKALERRGAEVSFFLCTGVRPQCDFKPATDAHTTRPLCWRCSSFPRRLLDAFALPHQSFDTLVDPALPRRAAALVGGRDLEGLCAFEYAGLPLGELCLPSLSRMLLRGDFQADPRATELLRGLLASAIVITDAAAKLLANTRPDAVVMCNGLFFEERIMFELAERAGIRTVTHEVGYRERSVQLANNAIVGQFPLGRLWERRRQRPLDATEEAALDHELSTRRAGGAAVKVLWPRMDGTEDTMRGELGIPPGQKLAVAFTNVLWDTAVFRKHVAFESMFDWLETSIELFRAHPDWTLVVRVHPAEVRAIMQESRERVVERLAARFPSLPENVRVVPPEATTNSYALVDAADAVLVYASSLGYESAAGGRAVVVAGDVHYARRGFTRDVEHRDAYPALVERALAERFLPSEEHALARRYAHLLLVEHMRPFPYVTHSPREARRLHLEHLDELAPGRDPGLDAICDGVLGALDFT